MLTAFFELCQRDVDARSLLYQKIPSHYTFENEDKAEVGIVVVNNYCTRLSPASLGSIRAIKNYISCVCS